MARYDSLRWAADAFRKPSAAVLAQRELEEARRSLLEHERSRDYHAAIVAFQRRRIAALEQQLAACECPGE